jgi:hypothetical protein
MGRQEIKLSVMEAIPLRCRNCNGCRSLAQSIATIIDLNETELKPNQERNIIEYIDYCEEGSGRQIGCDFHQNACNHPVLSTLDAKETDVLAEDLLEDE